MESNFDFAGYVTKANVTCTDGRVIEKDAFAHNDGKTVPLVWEHLHKSPDNVLGTVLLQAKEDGMYGYGKFNHSDMADYAKHLVAEKNIDKMSIYAGHVKEEAKHVSHGDIIEVSLVFAGANPGALIDNVCIAHSDGSEEVISEEIVASVGDEIITENIEFEHSDTDEEKTIEDVINTMNEEQKTAFYYTVARMAEKTKEDESEDVQHSDTEGGDNIMKENAFDKYSQTNKTEKKNTLTHSQIEEIFADATKTGSLKQSFMHAAATYGIDPVDVLFPDAREYNGGTPQTKAPEMTWVPSVLDAAHHSPFSRIKTTILDITADEARAKGYVKGKLKKEEIIKALKRVTTPTTVYKKQKIDRDDLLDITSFDVVAYLKGEMRTMLRYELARAALIGDGRTASDDDKINEDNIRPIWTENEVYAIHEQEAYNANQTANEIVDSVMTKMVDYKGSGAPTAFMGNTLYYKLLLTRDTMGHRLYNTPADLAAAMGVSKIVPVPQMDGQTRTIEVGAKNRTLTLQLIVVNMNDYTFGSDKGGELSMFDDFDIDYNQYKYLLETRTCGALIKPASALVFETYTETNKG